MTTTTASPASAKGEGALADANPANKLRKLLVPICAVAALGIGAYWLTAWLMGAASRWAAAGAETMKANTGLGLCLGGLALLLLAPAKPTRWRRTAGTIAGLLVLALGGLTLGEYAAGRDLGIDRILVTPSSGAPLPGSIRMSAWTALALTLLGPGLLALARGRQNLASYLGLLACLVEVVPAVGFLYGIEEFHTRRLATAIASPSVIALLALGIGLMLARRDTDPTALLYRQDPGGRLTRRLLPVVLALPLVLGYFAVEAQRHGVYDSPMGTGILVIALVLAFSLILWLSAAHLSRAATAQAKAEAKTRQQNAVLDGINRIFQAALTCDTEQALGRSCLEVAETVTGSKFGFIGEINAQGMVDGIAVSDPGWAACKMETTGADRAVPGGFKIHGIYGRVMTDAKGFFTNDPAAHPDRIGCPEGHPRLDSFLGVPLVHNGKVVGMVGLGNREGGYREEDLRGLEALAPAIVQVFMRRRTEEALRKSEERRKVLLAVTAERQRLNDVLNLLPAYVILLSEDHHVPFANRFFEQRFGQSKGKRCFEYLFSRTEPCEHCETYEVLKDGAPHRWEWTGPDGRNYDIHDFPFTDVDGSKMIMEVGLDITDVKKAETALREANEQLERRVAERTEALRASEELLRFALETSHTGAWDLDLVDHTTHRSVEHDRIFGYEKLLPEWTYEMFIERVLPEDRPVVNAKYRRAIALGSEWNFECRIRRADGEVRWIWAAGRHRADSAGTPRRMAGIVQDITERKQAEEALWKAKEELARANQDLERKVQERTAKLKELVEDLEHFSYTLIHDMRAPLRTMRGFAEMITEECASCLTSQPKAFLERIRVSAERMDGLITDSLNFTKAVRQELPLEPVDVAALLHGILDSYPEFQEPGANIVIDGQIPLVVANEAGLTQCLSNLLGNAVKFVATGRRPEVRIWAERVKAGGPLARDAGQAALSNTTAESSFVRVWIEDNGIGIPSAAMPRVFDMFHRVHKEYHGAGIGLALVRKVVQRMGGRVGVQSEEGKGSQFWFELRACDT